MDLKELSRAFRFRTGRSMIAASARLPAGPGRALFAGLGAAGFYLVERDRRLACANLGAAYPDWPGGRVRWAARRVFGEIMKNVFDLAAYRYWSESRRRQVLAVEGIDNLRGALSAGRGALLVGGHLGAFELIPVAMEREGIPVHAMSRPIREERLNRWLDEHRRALGVRVLPRDGLSAALAARRVLARGGVVGVLLDHRVRKGGLEVPFFGRPARFATGPVRLAVRSGAPVVPVAIGRRPDGGHLVRIGPALPAPPAAGHRREADALLVSAVGELETMIRRAPLEWAWIHPRWGRAGAAETARPKMPALRQAAPALLAILLAAGLGACERKGPEVRGTETTGPSSAIGGFTVRETVDGRMKWVLRADSAETYDNTNETQVQTVRVDFYDEKKEVTSVLTSDEGVVHKSSNNLTARGHVKLITRDGDTLTTEELLWNNAKNRVSTTQAFVLARPDGRLSGTGFESDPGLKNYKTEDVRIDAGGRPGHAGN